MSEVFFAGIKEKIIENLNESDESIKIAVAWFTDRKLLETIEKLLDKNIQIDIIVYENHINKKVLYENIYYKGAKIYFHRNLMHNKFCIIDNHTIINGSYNWTSNANNNKENIQVTKNSTLLIKNFKKEFEDLKVKSKSIDNYFKYSLEHTKGLIKDFESYFKENINSKYPHLLKIEDIDISDVNRGFKIEKGIYLIRNIEEERFLYWQLYFLRSGYSLRKINRILNVKSQSITILNKVIDVKFNDEHRYNLTEDRYLVETHKRYKNVYFIDKFGNQIGEKIQFSQKLPNGYYLQNFSNWGAKKYVIDIHLKKNPLDVINLKVEKLIGIIGQKKNENYSDEFLVGILDFTGITKIPFRYDKYFIDETNCRIEFKEYPFLIFHSNEKKVSKVWKDESEILPYKLHKYNFSGKLLNINEKDIIHNRNDESKFKFLFLSENGGKYASLYSALSQFGTNFPLIQEHGITSRLLDSLKESMDQGYISAKMALEIHEEMFEKEDQLHKIHQTGKYAKQGSCYIASMVYQNYDHPNVKFLRDFRDEVLIKFLIGRLFIKKYYKYSPSFVQFARDNYFIKKTLKKIVDLLVLFIKKCHYKDN